MLEGATHADPDPKTLLTSKGASPEGSDVEILDIEKAEQKAVSTGQEMVASLKQQGIIKTAAVEQAMLAIDRARYAPESLGVKAYEDAPQPIGMSAMLSAPHMHALALEALADHLVPGAKVLDVGAGSGYLSACMAHMVGPSGQVIGVDHLVSLVALGNANIRKSDGDLLNSGRLSILYGDGWKGCPHDAPFDCIHVGAAAEMVPEALLLQLKPGGRLVIPLGKQTQYFCVVDRDRPAKDYVKKQLMSVNCVPLVRTNVAAAGPASRRSPPASPPSSSAVASVQQNLLGYDAAGPDHTDVFSPPALEERMAAIPTEMAEPEVTVKVRGAPAPEPADAKCCWFSDRCRDLC
eukprot:TRINITY_DN3479_c0_g1_i1.p1 TRINITY_DN3479_c0_g1~~TRINITY_DN3479_c0_g1_i1.p1  ORF type:complete len:406 (+),score=84.66 TRINITY_DN3479_c0_g1_i1:170-1219(+)